MTDDPAAVFREVVHPREVSAVAVPTVVHVDTRVRRSCALPGDLLDRERALILDRAPGL